MMLMVGVGCISEGKGAKELVGDGEEETLFKLDWLDEKKVKYIKPETAETRITVMATATSTFVAMELGRIRFK